MGDRSSIEWTDATWSPIRARVGGAISDPLNLATSKIGWHCEHVSEGCRNCYAESINRRLGTGLDFKPGHRPDVEIFLDEKMLLAPLRWKAPRRIFVNSMTDTFAEFVKDEWLDRMFAIMALAPQHTFQVLTKRPERMRRYFSGSAVMELCERIAATVAPSTFTGADLWTLWPLPNIWLGVSAENQATFEERRQPLRDTPAAVRFFSLEPMLGPIDARDALATGLYHWVIVGGESGSHARPMHPDWARSLRDQCVVAGVPFFLKQWGEWAPAETMPIAVGARDCPPGTLEDNRDGKLFYAGRGRSTTLLHRVGKKAAGRLLDGIEHNAMPGAPS